MIVRKHHKNSQKTISSYRFLAIFYPDPNGNQWEVHNAPPPSKVSFL